MVAARPRSSALRWTGDGSSAGGGPGVLQTCSVLPGHAITKAVQLVDMCEILTADDQFHAAHFLRSGCARRSAELTDREPNGDPAVMEHVRRHWQRVRSGALTCAHAERRNDTEFLAGSGRDIDLLAALDWANLDLEPGYFARTGRMRQDERNVVRRGRNTALR